MLLAVDLHEYLIQMPAPTDRPHPRNTPFSDFRGEQRAEPVPPEPHRFMADLDAALMQEVLDVAQGQREPDIHHDCQADDLRAGLEVAKGAAFCHPPKLGHRLPPLKNFVLTVPAKGLFGICHQRASGGSVMMASCSSRAALQGARQQHGCECDAVAGGKDCKL